MAVSLTQRNIPWGAAAPPIPRLILGAPAPQTPVLGGLPPPALPAKINVKYRPKANCASQTQAGECT
jgi:hypothetical protein